jgi:citrate lyase subunit beta/citryl-CoA lyase
MPDSLRPRRSALYVPGSNAHALDKARSIAADVLILDLEDSVMPEAKEAAREAVAASVASRAFGDREVVIRVNGLETLWASRDIASVVASRPDAILVPKLSKIEDVRRVRSALGAAQASPDIQLWAMIETPLAILNAREIAAIAGMPGAPIACLVLGTNDLAAALGLRMRTGRAALLPHLVQPLAAARAHGLAILDGTFNGLDDWEGFHAECEEGRELGMDGKTLIHPRQVPIANQIFGPSEDEIRWARKVIEAFGLRENGGKAVIALDGQMVERLHERQAKRLLDMAKAIEALKSS